jgi:beta-alanine degradation protein BauB
VRPQRYPNTSQLEIRRDAGVAECREPPQKMRLDPTVTDPQLYKVFFENDRVRVMRYTDVPGNRTKPHDHPDSVLITLSNFRRRLSVGDRTVDVEKSPHEVIWNSAQTHVGENTGTTDTDVIFVELK